MDLNDIELIAIIVQLKNGEAHQVLAKKGDKYLALMLLGQMGDGLKLSNEIEPMTFKEKSLSKHCEYFQYDECDCIGKFCESNLSTR